MNKQFWNGKRVFITGNTGFKGSWLTIWLNKLGATLGGYALAPITEPSMYKALGLEKLIETTYGDICDYKKLLKSVTDFRPDIIIHMAAQPLVRRSYANPLETYKINVLGTANILECCRYVEGIKAVLNVTTDKCYENREWAWGYREIEPMGGHDPYSSSKGCSELITASYRRSYFSGQETTLVASARAGNVIGGGDWSEDRLIPDIIRSIETKSKLVIRNPNAIRPWQHVLEPLSGYLTLCERLILDGNEFADAWNFGPFDTDAREVQTVVDKILTCYGKQQLWERDIIENVHEAHFLKLDISKATNKLNWRPKLTLAEATEATAEWYLAFGSADNMLDLTKEQIKRYEAI